MTRKRLKLLPICTLSLTALVCGLACQDTTFRRNPEAPKSTPALALEAKPAKALEANPPKETELAECNQSAVVTQQVQLLLDEGKLDRSIRRLKAFAQQCPKQANPQTLLVATILEKLGSLDQARISAQRVAQEPTFSEKEKQQAKALLLRITKQKQQSAPIPIALLKQKEGIERDVGRGKLVEAWQQVENIRNSVLWPIGNLLLFADVAKQLSKPKEARELLDQALWAIEETRDPEASFYPLKSDSKRKFWFDSNDFELISREPSYLVVSKNTKLIVLKKNDVGSWNHVWHTDDSMVDCMVSYGAQTTDKSWYCTSFGTLLKIDPKTGKRKILTTFPFKPTGFTISKNDRKVVYWNEKELSSLNIKTGKTNKHLIDPGSSSRFSVEVSHDGGTIFVDNGFSDNSIHVFHETTGKHEIWPSNHAGEHDYRHFSLHPFRDEIAWRCDERHICIKNITQNRLLRKSPDLSRMIPWASLPSSSPQTNSGTFSIRLILASLNYSDNGKYIFTNMGDFGAERALRRDVIDANTLQRLTFEDPNHILAGGDRTYFHPSKNRVLDRDIAHQQNLESGHWNGDKSNWYMTFVGSTDSGLLASTGDQLYLINRKKSPQFLAGIPHNLIDFTSIRSTYFKNYLHLERAHQEMMVDVAKRKILWKSVTQDHSPPASFDQEGKRVARFFKQDLVISDTKTGKQLQKIPLSKLIINANYSGMNPSFQHFLAYDTPEHPIVVDITASGTLTNHPIQWPKSGKTIAHPEGWSWSPSGSRLALFDKKTLVVAEWKPSTHQVSNVHSFPISGEIQTSWVQHEKYFIFSDNNNLIVIDLAQGKIAHRIDFDNQQFKKQNIKVDRWSPDSQSSGDFIKHGRLWLGTFGKKTFLYSLPSKKVIVGETFSSWSMLAEVEYPDGMIEPLGEGEHFLSACPNHSELCQERYQVHGRLKNLLEGKPYQTKTN
jgi:hypothetical protein